MPWFIKTEKFTEETSQLMPEERRAYLIRHRAWVKELSESGVDISSGYLVNENQLAGGGGLLIIRADSFSEAKSLIKNDPMIIAGLVNWDLQEWIPVYGRLKI